MGQSRHKLAVFIGRFQPFHIGHHAVISEVAHQADSMLVLIGSAYRPRSWKNPFSYQERRAFLAQGVADIDMPVHILPLVDTLYSDAAWAANVRTAVHLHMRARGLDRADTEIALTGFEKDKSSQYLRWFPEWSTLPASPHRHEGEIVSATQMREALFFGATNRADRFGAAQMATVQRWMATHPQAVAYIRDEARYVKTRKKCIAEAEKVLGYPIAINTVDAVVLQAGHVLMVQRKTPPGKGLWALPGGHIDREETAHMAVLRELSEETGLSLPDGAPTRRQVFDHPERSETGWVRSEAFLFDRPDSAELAAVKGGSDATIARWVPIAEITPDTIFEDHFDIIMALVPYMPQAYSSILMAQEL